VEGVKKFGAYLILFILFQKLEYDFYQQKYGIFLKIMTMRILASKYVSRLQRFLSNLWVAEGVRKLGNLVQNCIIALNISVYLLMKFAKLKKMVTGTGMKDLVKIDNFV